MPGAKQTIFIAAQALLNPGDEVILFDPAWVSYAPCAELAGALPVYVPMSTQTSPQHLRAGLEGAIRPEDTSDHRQLPGQPDRPGVDAEQLEVVADAATAHNIWVMSDETTKSSSSTGGNTSRSPACPGCSNAR